VVADTNVLVAFSVVGELALLKSLFERICIPRAVEIELIDQGVGWIAAENVQRLIMQESWIESFELPVDDCLIGVGQSLDLGELEVIASVFRSGGVALLDEVPARRKARALGIDFIGSLGVLRMAKEQKLIDEVGPTIRRMQAGGIRFGDPLVNQFLIELGESP